MKQFGNDNIKNSNPPSLVSFSIINPDWLDDHKSEQTEDLIKQVVCYINNSNDDDNDSGDNYWLFKNLNNNNQLNFDINDEIVKDIGIVSALLDISNKFNGNNKTKVSCFDTNKTRTIINSIPYLKNDSNYWYSAKFKFASVALDNNKNDEIFIPNGLGNPKYLKSIFDDGFKLWILNNGDLLNRDIKTIDKSEISESLTKWWKTWIKNKFEFVSNYGLTNDAFFKNFKGLRHSSIKKPLGFTKNLNNRIDLFMKDKDNAKLIDMCILNSNWNPVKNWGVLYLNDKNHLNWEDLINHIKDLDLSLGLSTYSLTFNNWPSLKDYVNHLQRMNSIMPNGELAERSLVSSFWQNSLKQGLSYNNYNVYNPFVDYMPDLSSLNIVGSVIPNTLDTVSNITLHPWNTLSHLWGSSTNTDENEPDLQPNLQPTASTQASVSENSNECSSRSNSRNTVQSVLNGRQELEKIDKSGSYLLGLTKQGLIVTQNYYIKAGDGKEGLEFKLIKLVIYEINGILFLLAYNPDIQTDTGFYKKLSVQLDEIYENYFTDIVINQIKDSSDNGNTAKNEDNFFDFFDRKNNEYIIYDNGKYWSNIENIPPDYETLQYQIPGRIPDYERLQESEKNKAKYTLQRYVKLIKDKRLENLTDDWCDERNHDSSFKTDRKLVKIEMNKYCRMNRYMSDDRGEVWVAQIQGKTGRAAEDCAGNCSAAPEDRWKQWVLAGEYL